MTKVYLNIQDSVVTDWDRYRWQSVEQAKAGCVRRRQSASSPMLEGDFPPVRLADIYGRREQPSYLLHQS